MFDNEDFALANRRTILSGMLGGALTWAFAATSCELRIKDIAGARGLLFGSAFDRWVVPAYKRLIRQECQIITSDHSMKFGSIRPAPGIVDFAAADWLVSFAEKSHLLIRGHNLIWNEFLPAWVKQLSKNEMTRLLDRHIDEVAGRYAGRLHSWDVVNEPIWVAHKNVDGLRGGPWFAALGPDYIERSFRRARQADSHAKLVLNEAAIERPTAFSARRRYYLLKLIKRLLDKGVPLDAIGFESHLIAPNDYGGDSFLEFTQSIQDLGLDIYITELDVNNSQLPDDIAVRDRAVADCYRNYIRDVTSFPSVKVIITWQLSDKYSWRANRSGRGATARRPRPLPFDTNMQPKLAYKAIVDALSKK